MSERAYRIDPAQPVPDEVRRVARGRIDHAIDELRGTSDSTRAEAVHEARKDMKKLRALLRLVRDELGDGRLPPRERLLPRHRPHSCRACATPRSCSRRSATWSASTASCPARAAACARRSWRTASGCPGLAATGVAGGRSRRSRRRASGSRAGRCDADGFEAFEEGLRRNYRRGRRGFKARPGAAERRAHARVAQAGEGPLVPRDAAPGRLAAGAERARRRGARAVGAPRRRARRERPARLGARARERAQRRRPAAARLRRDRRGQAARAAGARRSPTAARIYADSPSVFADRLDGWWEATRRATVF